MLDVLALITAIVVLILLLYLRAVWAFSFSRISIRLVDHEASHILTDLLVPMEPELIELGFKQSVQVLFTEDNGRNETSSHALVYKNPQQHTLLWCHLPQAPQHANKPLIYWTTRLADNRLVTSENFDPFFQLIATAMTPAQTIASDSLREQLEKHTSFVASFDSPPSHSATDDCDIVEQGHTRNENLEWLLADGVIDQDKRGVLRSSFKTALKMLWLLLTLPKPKPNTEAIPAGQLVHLAKQVKRTREAEPALSAQLAIFSISILLALCLGTLIWDLDFVLILLIVIIVHELGHYLAMRAFGFKSVHILALPLVGGVTMGLESNPNAWRQAWISLMGPLPGIVLGWTLLLFGFQSMDETADASWPITIAISFLAINYLNLLPVLPLDGGRVLEALLPPKWLKPKAVGILLICTAGTWLALQYEMYLLALLIALQLLTIGSQLKTAALVTKLSEMPEFSAENAASQRLSLVFQTMETQLGACHKAMPRINQAERILKAFDTRPMHAVQSLIVSILFCLLLIVPLTLFITMLPNDSVFDETRWKAGQEAQTEQMHRLSEQAASLSTGELLSDTGFSPDRPTFSAAPESTISAHAATLPFALPVALLEVYRITNGFEPLGLLPVEQTGIAGEVIAEQLQILFSEENLLVSDAGKDATDAEISVSLQEISNWLYIANPYEEQLVLIEPSIGGKDSGGRILQIDYDTGYLYPSLRSWLEREWVNMQIAQDTQRRMEEAGAQQFQALRAKPLNQILAEYKENTQSFSTLQWLFTLMTDMPALPEAWPTGADDALIDATQRRLAVTFTPSFTGIYRLHNGMRMFGILPMEAIAAATGQRDSIQQLIKLKNRWRLMDDNGQFSETVLASPNLEKCLVVGGIRLPDAINPRILWCLDRPNSAVIDLASSQIYPDLENLIRERVARNLMIKNY